MLLRIAAITVTYSFVTSVVFLLACQTPDGQQGDCKPIKDCPFLYALLDNLTNQTISHLRRSRCEGNRDITNPSVCCPRNLHNKSNDQFEETSTLNADSCGLSLTSTKITAGPVIELGEHNWNVILKYQIPFLLTLEDPQEFYCGGALVSKRHVLTAAHCIKGRHIPKYTQVKSVRLGEHNLDTEIDCEKDPYGETCNHPSFEVSVEKIFTHEEYNPEDPAQWHDIALIKLKKDVTFSDSVGPICFPSKEIYTRGMRLKQSGWGIHSNNVTTAVKSIIQVDSTDNDYCESLLRVKIGKKQFCGKTVWNENCISDNGEFVSTIKGFNGSIHYHIVGIASISTCNGSVYARVDQYLEWIADKISK